MMVKKSIFDGNKVASILFYFLRFYFKKKYIYIIYIVNKLN